MEKELNAMEYLKKISLEDGIFFALVLFALGSSVSGHLGKNAEIAAMALCAIRLLRGNLPMERLHDAKWLAIVLGFFFGTMTISALWSGNFSAALKLCPMLNWCFEALLFFCVLFCVRREKQIFLLWAALFLSLLATDVHMLYALSKHANRPPGFSRSILETSSIHAMLIPAMAFFAVDPQCSNRTKKICRVLLALALVGGYILGTRGIWLAIPPTLLLIFAYAGNGWKRALRYTAICVLCIFTVAMLTPASIRERIAPANLVHDNSVAARLAMYEGSTKIFLDHPLLGVGTANFRKYWTEQYFPPDKPPSWKKFTHPHSIYFQYLVDGGLVGFAGFAALFGYLLWWSWRRRYTRRGIILFCATLSLLLYGLSDHPLGSHEAARIYWFIIGISFAEEAVASPEQGQTG